MESREAFAFDDGDVNAFFGEDAAKCRKVTASFLRAVRKVLVEPGARDLSRVLQLSEGLGSP